MNWIGGARNRFQRVNNDQKKQKEFFERRKLANLARNAESVLTPVGNKKGISRDILHIQCVKQTKRCTDPTGPLRAGHTSPDMKTRRLGERAVNQVDLLRGRSKLTLGRGRSRSCRERLHLPNASPCKQASVLDLADASDAEHAEPRRFMHLPSYQSTPIDGYSRLRPNEQIHANQSGWHSKKVTASKTQQPLNNAVETHVLPAWSLSKTGQDVNISHLDETLLGCDFLNYPEAPVEKNRSEKKVNFSHVNEYHSLSDESLSDRYSVFESFLHHNEEPHHSLLPSFDEVVSTGIRTTSYDATTSTSTRQHVMDQSSMIMRPAWSHDFVTSPHVGESCATDKFLPDYTPTKGNPPWESYQRTIESPAQYFSDRFHNGSFVKCHESSRDAKSLSSWLCSKTDVDELDEMERSLAVTPGSAKTISESFHRLIEASHSNGSFNYGASGGVIVSQDESIPGMDSDGPSAWKRIKIEPTNHVVEEKQLLHANSQKSNIFSSWTVNRDDGLHSADDEQSHISTQHDVVPAYVPDKIGDESTDSVLSKAAEKLTQLKGKLDLMDKSGVQSPESIDHPHANSNKTFDNTKVFVEKACSPIQAIFPKMNKEVGIQTSSILTSSRAPPMATTGTQTDSPNHDRMHHSSIVSVPFVMVGDHMTPEGTQTHSPNHDHSSIVSAPFVMLSDCVTSVDDDLMGKQQNDPHPSQSSSDESTTGEKSVITRSKSKRIQNLTQP